MDPPYKYPHLHEILQLIVKNQWLKERGVLVLESSDKIDILPIEGFFHTIGDPMAIQVCGSLLEKKKQHKHLE